MNQIDTKLVGDFFDLLYVNGSCLEVRCFQSQVDFNTRRIVHSKYETTVSGWFLSSDELCAELSRIDKVSCYISVNPVQIFNRPSHAKNTLKVLKHGDFSTDSDISIIRYLIVDIDPIRLPGHSKINSTNQELFECINVRDQIIKDLDLSDHCLYGSSGNGAFILISMPDLPNNDETKINLSKFLNHLSERYTNKHCVIDTNSKNASRLLGVPGSWKYRDQASTLERPHRRVEIHGRGHNAIVSTDAVQSISMG
jgi:hypothetical protein